MSFVEFQWASVFWSRWTRTIFLLWSRCARTVLIFCSSFIKTNNTFIVGKNNSELTQSSRSTTYISSYFIFCIRALMIKWIISQLTCASFFLEGQWGNRKWIITKENRKKVEVPSLITKAWYSKRKSSVIKCTYVFIFANTLWFILAFR